MTDADSIWESKLSRIQDPNLEKMKFLVGHMGELRKRRQERDQPCPATPDPQEGAGERRPWCRQVFGGI
jgi:hypothetical protein